MADAAAGSRSSEGHRRRNSSCGSDDGVRAERQKDQRYDKRATQKSGRRDDSSRRYPNDRRGDERDSRRERKHRDRSRSRERPREDRRSRSAPIKRQKRSESKSRSPPPNRRSRAPLPSQDESFRGGNGELTAGGDGAPPVEKQKPNYKPTGLLAKEANTVAGTTTVLKYHEPPEARKPPSKQQWRMYVFKDKDLLDTIYLHTRSAWLLGRDEKVTDYLLEHPSASKQHAVIQFRHRTSTNEFGDKSGKVKPYLIDLDSANGTKMNGEKIKPSRYVELIDGDVVGFGDSEREYVMMLPPADGA